MPLHEAALGMVRQLAEGAAAWAVPVFCVGEFLRIVSHPRIFDPPTPVVEALESVESLLASPSVRLLSPGPRYLRLLDEVIRAGNVSGNLVYDAQIAAVCLEHGARTLLTEDRDFARFPQIVAQPLATFSPT